MTNLDIDQLRADINARPGIGGCLVGDVAVGLRGQGRIGERTQG